MLGTGFSSRQAVLASSLGHYTSVREQNVYSRLFTCVCYKSSIWSETSTRPEDKAVS